MSSWELSSQQKAYFLYLCLSLIDVLSVPYLKLGSNTKYISDRLAGKTGSFSWPVSGPLNSTWEILFGHLISP